MSRSRPLTAPLLAIALALALAASACGSRPTAKPAVRDRSTLPSGRATAAVLAVGEWSGGIVLYHLWLASLDGTTTQLPRRVYLDRGLAMSEDGRSVAFVGPSGDGTATGVHVMDAASGRDRVVLADERVMSLGFAGDSLVVIDARRPWESSGQASSSPSASTDLPVRIQSVRLSGRGGDVAVASATVPGASSVRFLLGQDDALYLLGRTQGLGDVHQSVVRFDRSSREVTVVADLGTMEWRHGEGVTGDAKDVLLNSAFVAPNALSLENAGLPVGTWTTNRTPLPGGGRTLASDVASLQAYDIPTWRPLRSLASTLTPLANNARLAGLRLFDSDLARYLALAPREGEPRMIDVDTRTGEVANLVGTGVDDEPLGYVGANDDVLYLHRGSAEVWLHERAKDRERLLGRVIAPANAGRLERVELVGVVYE